jgi:class 3 adenylate cyclase
MNPDIRFVRRDGASIAYEVFGQGPDVANGDIRGIAVHIGARVAAIAGPNEVFVSSTVKGLYRVVNA